MTPFFFRISVCGTESPSPSSPGWTYVDDVSIIDTSTLQELISNGGFENGTTSWSGTALFSIQQPESCRTQALGVITMVHQVLIL
jgi:hypothetical protein